MTGKKGKDKYDNGKVRAMATAGGEGKRLGFNSWVGNSTGCFEWAA
jgi:hypothetical protein